MGKMMRSPSIPTAERMGMVSNGKLGGELGWRTTEDEPWRGAWGSGCGQMSCTTGGGNYGADGAGALGGLMEAQETCPLCPW